jgi:hypothetical protein
MTLPSGLPETVGDEELISRFLTSRNHYNASSVKPSAYLPNPKTGDLSVARHSAEPISESERIAKQDFNLEKASGVALLHARAFREEGLDFEADDNPPRHADVVGWPWLKDDPELSKAKQKLKAASLAQKAKRIIYPKIST